MAKKNNQGRAGARRFRANILAGHKEDAVEVPFDPTLEWRVGTVSIRVGRKGVPVAATLSGVRFKSFVVRRSSRFFLLLPSEVLEGVGAAVGDEVSLQVTPEKATT